MGDKRFLFRDTNGIIHPGVLVAIAAGAGIGIGTNFMADAWIKRNELVPVLAISPLSDTVSLRYGLKADAVIQQCVLFEYVD